MTSIAAQTLVFSVLLTFVVLALAETPASDLIPKKIAEGGNVPNIRDIAGKIEELLKPGKQTLRRKRATTGQANNQAGVEAHATSPLESAPGTPKLKQQSEVSERRLHDNSVPYQSGHSTHSSHSSHSGHLDQPGYPGHSGHSSHIGHSDHSDHSGHSGHSDHSDHFDHSGHSGHSGHVGHLGNNHYPEEHKPPHSASAFGNGLGGQDSGAGIRNSLGEIGHNVKNIFQQISGKLQGPGSGLTDSLGGNGLPGQTGGLGSLFSGSGNGGLGGLGGQTGSGGGLGSLLSGAGNSGPGAILSGLTG